MTGPIHRAEPTTWQSRPSGALSSPSPWSQQGAYGSYAGTSAASATSATSSEGASSGPFTSRFSGSYLPYEQSQPTGAQPGHSAPAATAVTQRPSRVGRTAAIIGATVVLALGAGFGGGLLGAKAGQSTSVSDTASPASSTASPVTIAAGNSSVQTVAAKVLPSVVSIVAQGSSSEGEGSGVILTADGLVLTNNHVVAGATTLTVRFNDDSGATATVVGTDATDDLAVIKVKGVSGLTPATLGSSAALQVGQQVVAIGAPLGLSSTVTAGIVSALNRPVTAGSSSQNQSQQASEGTVYNAVQTDAAINPGNSGGALVDMNGAVIGINSAIATASSGSSSGSTESGSIGVGFAIPIDQAHRIAQEIINTGHASRAVLGVGAANYIPAGVTANTSIGEDALSTGAKLSQIVPGQAADKAGLKTGDVITKLGNQSIQTGTALVAAVRSQNPGGTVQLTYQRGSQTQTVTVTLGSAAAN